MENSGCQHDKSVSYADTFTVLGLGLWITEGGKVKGSKKAGSSIWLNVRKGLPLHTAWQLNASFSQYWYSLLSMS